MLLVLEGISKVINVVQSSMQLNSLLGIYKLTSGACDYALISVYSSQTFTILTRTLLHDTNVFPVGCLQSHRLLSPEVQSVLRVTVAESLLSRLASSSIINRTQPYYLVFEG